MKSWILLLGFLISSPFCRAQDAVVTVSPDMFNPVNEILISKLDGWQFRKAGDTAWIKLNPSGLSGKLADTNSRLEGWLRFRFILSPDFSHIPLALRYSGWAAAEIFVDGKPVQKFGTIGTDRISFLEYNASNKMPVPVSLQPGVEHELSIRFADYVNPLSSGEIKSATTDLHRFIRFTGPEYQERLAKHIREWPVYSTLWVSICTVLTFLFWLLAFLNRKEKNLTLFAVCATVFLITFCFKVLTESGTISFTGYVISFGAFNLFSTISICLTLIIVARVFKNKVARWLKILVALLFITGVVTIISGVGAASGLITLFPVFVYLWYIISSRKILKGAQWAIVIGLLIYSFMVFLYVAMIITYQTEFFPYYMLIASGLILSFPLSLLVYVALRFKEIVTDVRQQAEQVLRLSEEKKEQALKQQKILEEEVLARTSELQTSLENLQSTQKQLIQSEKMASLGELTAGIAHEIQNPLNFVNNFSEVSNELIDEMKAELDKGELDEAKAIAEDVKQNLEKILHHGKRADGIVKGMLQHSRSSSGTKELTDINALADEYLRLAYHGLRAKDKSFNATMKTDFDTTIGNILILPQDIGRVILNLITNAFYVVAEKKKQQSAGMADYEPTVSVSTKKAAGKVSITVKDNGNGIPQKILDKIFQPFFTTKPTGQGTGLGLSLSYDIIKAHGGEITLSTKENEGSAFVIELPV